MEQRILERWPMGVVEIGEGCAMVDGTSTFF
jgi:hypothetical protein